MWLLLLTVGFILWLLYEPFRFWIIDPWLIHKHLWAQGIPGRHIPIIGEILNFRKSIQNEDPFRHGVALAEKFGDYYHVSFGPVARLDTYDPELINGILKTNARCYHKAYIMRLVLGVLLGNKNLLMAEDDIHAQHRRLIAPVFQHQNMNSMVSLMVDVTNNLMKKWLHAFSTANEASTPLVLNIHEEMSTLTLDIVTSCVFGTEIVTDEDMHQTIHRIIGESLQLIEKRLFNMTAILPIINRLPLPSKQHIDRNLHEGMNLVRNLVENRKKGLTKSSCKGPDLLDLLLAASNNTEKKNQLTDEEIYEEALTFVAAGHETTATLMTWTLYNLVKNPDICRQLEAEVDSIFNDIDEITPATLTLLTYTDAVLKESLRLHQPVPAIVRSAVKDNTLVASDGKSIHIKKGTGIFLNFYMLHHSPKYWKEPFKFDPSRFNDKQSDKLLLSFSAGPRSCIGQNFAMLEAKIMLALIIRHFRFELEPGQKLTPEIVVTMRFDQIYFDLHGTDTIYHSRPKYGMRMRILPRKQVTRTMRETEL